MKKFVVLMLVLGMASLASATVVYSYASNSDGTGAITEVGINTTFYMVISGLVSDFPQNIKIYDAYENASGAVDYADFIGITLVDNGNGYPAAGNLNATYYDGTYDGIELLADQSNPSGGADAIDGAWAIAEVLSLSTLGTWNPDLVDSGWSPIGSTANINIVPEPMTMVLLGIGGLFLRRRKA